MLRTSDLDYDLPESAIAVTPAEPRDAARLLVISRSDPARIEHRYVRDLPELLAPRDLLVFNATRVLRARLLGHRADTGGLVEGLYLHDAPAPDDHPAASPSAPSRSSTPLRWAVLLRGKRMKEGVEVALHRPDGAPAGARLHLRHRLPDEPGAWIVEVHLDQAAPGPPFAPGQALLSSPTVSSPALLEAIGATPLPPYILKARKHQSLAIPDPRDRERYQTVFASRAEQPDSAAPAVAGSVAAPTAGLHFTPDLLHRLDSRGIARTEVILHVGTGTFRPVETEHLEDHPMHEEWCSLPASTRRAIAQARARTVTLPPVSPRRVIAVGTTTARTLESYARLEPLAAEPLIAEPPAGEARSDADPSAMVWPTPPPAIATRLLITPGYAWRWTDGLLTNFHLPRSTLLAMVAALLPEGVPRLLDLYRLALDRGYRFYSYGDAMLILP